MLFHLLFMSLVYQGLSVESFGKDFITAFPENIAYYYPKDGSHTLQITAFYSNTAVSITVNYTSVFNDKLQSGQTKIVYFPKYVEQYQFTNSTVFVRVNSTKLVVVRWVSQRANSVQSNVVLPLRVLGNFYSIPFIDYNQMMTSLYSMDDLMTSESWRFNSFRLIIINAVNAVNAVTIQGVSTDASNVALNPYELYQFQTTGSDVSIYSTSSVAVLLTHPCVETRACDCNMLVNHVFPQNLWGGTFVVPSLKSLNITWLQVTSTTSVTLQGQNIKSQRLNSSELLPFAYLESGSQFITAANNVSVRLVGPGLIVELMPETMFAGCFFVQMNSSKAEAIIIATTATRGSVYVDGDLLSSTEWESISNSNYSIVSVSLSGTHVIWHPTSKIGVYVFEQMDSGVPYGGPAVTLNDEPDRDGCVADPGQYNTTTDVMTWAESINYCLNESLQLSTPIDARTQQEVSNFLQTDGNTSVAWIGLRRSLLTLDWYWLTGNASEYNVSYTNWAEGQPDKPWKALCASVSQNATKGFSWESLPCCTKIRAVCYKNATYFNDLIFDPLFSRFYIIAKV